MNLFIFGLNQFKLALNFFIFDLKRFKFRMNPVKSRMNEFKFEMNRFKSGMNSFKSEANGSVSNFVFEAGVSVILCSRRISIDPGHGRDQSTVLIL